MDFFWIQINDGKMMVDVLYTPIVLYAVCLGFVLAGSEWVRS